jgi:hypothetical protein
LAGIGILAALLLFAVGHRRAVPAVEVDDLAADLDALVRETAAGVEARAVTLSQLPRLGWIVATDAATVSDLTADELEFRPQRGERIELSQVRNRDGQVRLLRRLPAGNAKPLPLGRPGPHLVVAEGRAEVVTVMPISPRVRADELHGALAVAKTIDTTAASRRLEALGVSVRLQAAGGSLTLGRGAPVAERGAATVALKSPAAEGAVLAYGRGGGAGWLRAMAWLLLAVSLGAAGVLWRRGTPGRSPGLSAPVPAPPSPEARARSGDLVVDDDGGGSDLTYDPDATVLAEPGVAAQAAISRARSGSVPIVPSPAGSGPHWNGPTAKSGADGADPTTLEYRSLFGEYVSLRRTCGEPTADLDRDDFVNTLRHTRERLIKEDAVSDVHFRLAFANGRAVIRFTTVP